MKTQKTVIVTGASQGIGACIVKTFLESGYHVVATARSMEKSGFQASQQLALVEQISGHDFPLLPVNRERHHSMRQKALEITAVPGNTKHVL